MSTVCDHGFVAYKSVGFFLLDSKDNKLAGISRAIVVNTIHWLLTQGALYGRVPFGTGLSVARPSFSRSGLFTAIPSRKGEGNGNGIGGTGRLSSMASQKFKVPWKLGNPRQISGTPHFP